MMPTKSEQIVNNELTRIRYWSIIQDYRNRKDLKPLNIYPDIGTIVLAIVSYSSYVIGRVSSIDSIYIWLDILQSYGPVHIHQTQGATDKLCINDFEIYKIIEE